MMTARINKMVLQQARALLLMLSLSLLSLQAQALQWPVNDEVMGQVTQRIRTLAANEAAIRLDGVILSRPVQVSRFYQQREFRPIWIDWNGVRVDAAELLQAVKRADTEGLPVTDYPVAAIEKYLVSDIESPAALAKLDLLLTDTFLLYSRNVRSGRFGPRRANGSWLLPYTPFDGSALLTQALTENSMSSALASLPPTHGGYQQLRAVLRQYQAVAAKGGWPKVSPGETLEPGAKGPRVLELRERLRQSGDLAGQVAEPDLFDEALSQAVQAFQRRNGFEPDGRVGKRTLMALNTPVESAIRQIEVNMERWRWLPREMPSEHILVNMAGYELDVYDADVQAMNMRVIVGRNYRQTPVFASEVTDVVLNPYWYVPRLIFREDLLPALRKDPGKLERLKMRLLSNGSEVDVGHIDWASVDVDSFPYTLRQEPGPSNALGRIKFLLPDSQGIYLHDTPDRHLFDRTARAFSSGCIRLEQPLQLAQYLLADPGKWDIATLQEAIDAGSQRTLPLPEPVPIYFTYWTAWVDQAGALQLRNDIYHRDISLLKLWEKNAT